MVGVALGPDHVLDREPAVDEVAVRRDVHLLEVVEERRPVVPGHVGGTVDDVVAVQRRDGDEGEVRDVEPARPVDELLLDLFEHRLLVVDEVHLVHAQHEVRDPQQRRDEGVALRLLKNAIARVDEDQRQVGGRRAGHHVARVLNVTGRVGDDELPLRRGEVPVGDVDRDALLPLRAEAVRDQCQVGVLVPALAARALDRLELVLEDLLRVVQQAADERALAVVDGAGGRQPEHLH